MRAAAQHGTTSGYTAHLRRGEQPCNPCRDAKAAYWAEYKRRNPEQAQKDKARVQKYSLARQRALARLAETYPEAYGVFLAEERAKIRGGSP